MSRIAVRPYLIAKDAEGAFRVTIRTTRLNSQGYPLISSALLDGSFPNAASARVYIRDQFQAESTDIVTE